MPCPFTLAVARQTLVGILVIFLAIPFGPLGGMFQALAQEQSGQSRQASSWS